MAKTPWILVGLMFVILPAGNAEICNNSNGCEFWDNQYHEYILNDWDTTQIDVLIIPPASAYTLRDIQTVEKSIDAWETGIDDYGASWLTGSFDIQHYTVGLDYIPPAVLADPEVIVTSAEFNPFVLFGIGYAVPWMACLDGALGASPTHQHDGSIWSIQQPECDNLGNTCFVVNTNFAFGGERRMFDLNSHEFGHCLGIGHVGDALDFDAKTVPMADIMSYQYDPNQVHCVSNLNVRSVEGVFGKVLDQPASIHLDSGDFYTMSPSSYRQVSCANP